MGHSKRHGCLVFTGCSLKFIFVTGEGEGRHGIGKGYSETKESSRGLVKEGTGVWKELCVDKRWSICINVSRTEKVLVMAKIAPKFY
jgi:hypothetical protein